MTDPSQPNSPVAPDPDPTPRAIPSLPEEQPAAAASAAPPVPVASVAALPPPSSAQGAGVPTANGWAWDARRGAWVPAYSLNQSGPAQAGAPPAGYAPYGQPASGYGGYPPPSAAGAARPAYQAPPPTAIKRSKLPLVIGAAMLLLIVAAVAVPLLGLVLAAGSGSTTSSRSSSFAAFNPFASKVAILEVNGVLGEGEAYTYEAETSRLKALVDKWFEDDSIKGMLIRINSPGGAVSATQDLHQAIERFRNGTADIAGRPVYVSMGDVAASGGYYIAMGADEVYVNPGTLTGSVGVIFSLMGYEGLMDKVGVESRVIKSGQFKDIGSGARPMTPEERELLETMILDVFEQFYEHVHAARADDVRELLADQRGVSPSEINDDAVHEHLRAWCDGRIFSGRQAVDYGMADHIGTMDDALAALLKTLKLPEDTAVVPTPKPAPPGLFGTVQQGVMGLRQAAPGSVKLEYRFAM